MSGWVCDSRQVEAAEARIAAALAEDRAHRTGAGSGCGCAACEMARALTGETS